MYSSPQCHNDNDNDLDGAGGSSVKIAFSRTLKKLHIGGGFYGTGVKNAYNM